MVAFVVSVVICGLLALGAYCVIFNWVLVYVNWKNRNDPSVGYVSGIPLVAQICAFNSALLASQFDIAWIPTFIFWVVALSDRAFWHMLIMPFVLLWLGLISRIKGAA